MRIDATGPYVGKFTRAEVVVSREGTTGIDFSFIDVNGNKADYLTLWLSKKDGTALRGRKVLDAMMACMKVRQLVSQEGVVTKYDFDEKKDVQVKATLLPALMNAPIGLLLQREGYYPNNGGGKKF